MVNKMRH